MVPDCLPVRSNQVSCPPTNVGLVTSTPLSETEKDALELDVPRGIFSKTNEGLALKLEITRTEPLRHQCLSPGEEQVTGSRISWRCGSCRSSKLRTSNKIRWLRRTVAMRPVRYDESE